MIFFGECIDLGHQLVHVVAWGDVWLWDMLHVFINGIHVVDAGRQSAAAVFSEVSCLSAVKAWSFWASGSIILLYWGVSYPVVFGLCRVGVCVILVHPVIVGRLGARKIHWHWYVVIGWPRGVGRVVSGSLLLLLWPRLVLAVSPPMRGV
jgi:hypothetical protein